MAQNDMLAEMHRSITQLCSQVGSVEGKIDTFLNQMKAQDDRTTDLEVRTRKVENRQHWYAGAGAALAILIDKFAPGIFSHSS